MGPKENRDVIEGFLQERRETERKEKLLKGRKSQKESVRKMQRNCIVLICR